MKSRFLISKMKKPILFFFLRLLECLLYLKSNVEDHSVLKSPKLAHLKFHVKSQYLFCLRR